MHMHKVYGQFSGIIHWIHKGLGYEYEAMFVLASSPGSFCLVVKIVAGSFHHVFVKLEMRLHIHTCVAV